MEEEGKSIKRKKRFSEFRIGMFKKLRAEAKGNLGAIEKALNAEEKNPGRSEAETEDESWKQAVEAGEKGLVEAIE